MPIRTRSRARGVNGWVETIERVQIIIDDFEFSTIGDHFIDFDITYLPRYYSSPEPQPQPQLSSEPITGIISFGKHISVGSLYDVYSAKYYLTPETKDDYIDVIVKYTYCQDFDDVKYFGDDQSLVFDEDSALNAVKNDHKFYTEHLLDLQSNVIPKHFGTFIEPETKVCCIILEDVGKPIGKIPSLNFIKPEEKAKILKLYEIIHSKKVVQGGPFHENVYSRKDGTIRIIGFYSSSAVSDDNIWLAWERYEVKMNCGLEKHMTYKDFCARESKRKSGDGSQLASSSK